MLSHGNAISSQTDIGSSQKLSFKKLQENFLISYEINSKINEDPSMFVSIYNSNLLEKLEIFCINTSDDDSFSFINHRYHEYYLDLIEFLIIKNDFLTIRKLIVNRKNIEMVKNKNFLPIYKGIIQL